MRATLAQPARSLYLCQARRTIHGNVRGGWFARRRTESWARVGIAILIFRTGAFQPAAVLRRRWWHEHRRRRRRRRRAAPFHCFDVHGARAAEPKFGYRMLRKGGANHAMDWRPCAVRWMHVLQEPRCQALHGPHPGLDTGHTLTPAATSKDHMYIHPMDVYACTYSCLLLICQFAGAQSPTNSQSPTEEKHNGSSPFHSER